MEMTQVSLHWEVNKLKVAYPYNATLFGNKKERRTVKSSMNEIWKDYVELNKQTPNDSIYMECSK